MSERLMIIPGSPTMSMVLWGIIVIAILYLARTPAHSIINSLFYGFYLGFRMISRSFSRMATRLYARNREVLLEYGRESSERRLDREFMRLDAAVKRDLGNYPALHREIQEKMHQLELDYRNSTEEEAPNVDGWEKAISAVSKIPTRGHTMVAEVLDDINDSFNNTHQEVIKEYRRINKERHKILGRLIPTVRTMNATMEKVDKNIRELTERSREVGKYMDDFKEMIAKTDKAENKLSSSTLFQFVVSTIVLTIAIFGAYLNFTIIAEPMKELVPANQHVNGVPVYKITAMVIIAIEIAMGLFLMELLHVTRLFPGVALIDDRMRRRLMWVSFIILLSLAFVEMGLGYTRDINATNTQAVMGTITNVQVESTVFSKIANMLLGLFLPFALMFIAIPLEAFVHTCLTGARAATVEILRSFAFILRMLGMLFRHIGQTITKLYDLIIIVPLWVETVVINKGKDSKRKGKVGAIS